MSGRTRSIYSEHLTSICYQSLLVGNENIAIYLRIIEICRLLSILHINIILVSGFRLSALKFQTYGY